MKGIELIKDMISRAMSGSLSLSELYEKWPEAFADSKFFESIYDDVESAVEHMPANLDGTFNIKRFQESKEYHLLKCDLIILLHLNSNDVILKGWQDLKQKIVSSHLDEEEIKELIAKQ